MSRIKTRFALGTFPHIELWREILEASSSKDVSLVDSMLHGFPLMGAIVHEWPIKNPMPESFYDTGILAYRAWCARQRVISKLEKGYGSIEPAIAVTLWEKMIEDVTSGYALGLFLSQSVVSNLLGREDWVCMPRFPVCQSGKIRPVDDGSRNAKRGISKESMTDSYEIQNSVFE